MSNPQDVYKIGGIGTVPVEQGGDRHHQARNGRHLCPQHADHRGQVRGDAQRVLP